MYLATYFDRPRQPRQIEADVLRRFRGLIIFGLAVLAWMIILSPLAFAQDGADIVVAVPPTEVVLNWGDFLAILLANLAQPDSVAWTAFGLAMTWLVAKLPGPAQWAFKVFKVDQLLEKSLVAAINSTKGAVVGQSLSVNVGSEVLAKAAQYAVDNGQKGIIDWMGGRAGIEEKLLARMTLDSMADGAELVDRAHQMGDLKITEKPPTLVRR